MEDINNKIKNKITERTFLHSSLNYLYVACRSPGELYEITCLVGSLLPPLPGDGVFAVDTLLASPGTIVRDPVVWQWQDDRLVFGCMFAYWEYL